MQGKRARWVLARVVGRSLVQNATASILARGVAPLREEGEAAAGPR
jgi:hypothetical protein